MSRLLHFVTIALLVCGCNYSNKSSDNTIPQRTEDLEAVQEEPAQKQETIAGDSTDFKAAFELFFSALQASDTATINQFVHPQHGLWIIEQPGALPRMTFVKDISSFKRQYQDRSFLTIKDEVKNCDLKQEAWPTFDCADVDYDAGTSGFSKDGCFVAGPERFVKSGYWNYADLPPAEVKQIEATLPLVQKSVLHTATSFEFHFGFVEGRWRLLFAKLIYPCSA